MPVSADVTICQAIVETSSAREWQDELPAKRCLDMAVAAMSSQENSLEEGKLSWVPTPVETDVRGKGVRQIRQVDDWQKAVTKVTTWEMIKDKKAIKIMVKYH